MREPAISLTVCLLVALCSAALLVFRFASAGRARRINIALGALISLLGACATASQFLPFELSRIPGQFFASPSSPGYLPPSLALAFTLLGLMVCLRALSVARLIQIAGRLLVGCVFLVLLAGLAVHWLEIELICNCYRYVSAIRMPLAGAAATLLLAMAAWALWADMEGPGGSAREQHPAPIVAASAIVLVTTTLTLGVAGLLLVQAPMIQAVRGSMEQTVLQRRILVGRLIEEGMRRANSGVNAAEFVKAVRLFDTDPGSPQTVASVYSATESLRARGFAAAAIHGANRGFMAVGSFVASPQGQLDLKAPQPARLLWSNGYLLNVGIPEVDKDGLAGFVVIQEPLDGLDQTSPAQNALGRTGDIDFCGAVLKSLECFPQRFSSTPFTLDPTSVAQPSPVSLAVQGRSGSVVTVDRAGERVLAAYGPVGNTGLGVALHVRLSELYAPVRRRVWFVAALLAIFILVDLWRIDRRARLVLSQVRRSAEELATTAECEQPAREDAAVPDGFVDQSPVPAYRLVSAENPIAGYFAQVHALPVLPAPNGHVVSFSHLVPPPAQEEHRHPLLLDMDEIASARSSLATHEASMALAAAEGLSESFPAVIEASDGFDDSASGVPGDLFEHGRGSGSTAKDSRLEELPSLELLPDGEGFRQAESPQARAAWPRDAESTQRLGQQGSGDITGSALLAAGMGGLLTGALLLWLAHSPKRQRRDSDVE